MKLLVDRTGEQFLEILQESGDTLTVQFITNEGNRKGKPFQDNLSGLFLTGWKPRTTSTAIGLERFKQGKLEDPKVSFALHQLYPLGRDVKLPSGDIATIASYANTHAHGYYMFVRLNDELTRLKITPDWELNLPLKDWLCLITQPQKLKKSSTTLTILMRGLAVSKHSLPTPNST